MTKKTFWSAVQWANRILTTALAGYCAAAFAMDWPLDNRVAWLGLMVAFAMYALGAVRE